MSDIDANQLAEEVNKEMLGRKSPLWWRINGARFLSGKSKLVRDLNEIDMAPAESEDAVDPYIFPVSSDYQANLDSMTTDTGFRFEIPQVLTILAI